MANAPRVDQASPEAKRVSVEVWVNGFFDFLDNQRSAWAIALCLSPALLLLLMPTGMYPNEYNYLMLAFRRVSPSSFSHFSAAFDVSNARIVFETALGFLVKWLGYFGAQVVLRLSMTATYALAIGYLLSALGLSALDALIVLGVFVISGEDILGKEWLFLGAESKTFAYALVMLGLAHAIKGRMTVATLVAALATYVHFLVGGFWLMAILGYDAVRDFSLRRLARHFVQYVVLIGPLLVLIAYDQFGIPVAARVGLNANMIYATRAPHHVAPFLNLSQFLTWAPDIALLFALTAGFLMLMRHDLAQLRPLIRWITWLLCYLVAALALSALDAKTAYFAKFYLFRPSSLILFCLIAALVGLYNDMEDKSGIKQRLRQALVLFILPVAAIKAVDGKWSDLSGTKHAIRGEIADLNAFVVRNTGPDDIVLVQSGNEYLFPLVAMPMLIDRPTLVSYKFVPTNPRDIYRWNDLIQYRNQVFTEACKGIGRFPVRYLLMLRRPNMKIPCGNVVWRSNHFALVEP